MCLIFFIKHDTYDKLNTHILIFKRIVREHSNLSPSFQIYGKNAQIHYSYTNSKLAYLNLKGVYETRTWSNLLSR